MVAMSITHIPISISFFLFVFLPPHFYFMRSLSRTTDTKVFISGSAFREPELSHGNLSWTTNWPTPSNTLVHEKMYQARLREI